MVAEVPIAPPTGFVGVLMSKDAAGNVDLLLSEADDIGVAKVLGTPEVGDSASDPAVLPKVVGYKKKTILISFEVTIWGPKMGVSNFEHMKHTGESRTNGRIEARLNAFQTGLQDLDIALILDSGQGLKF